MPEHFARLYSLNKHPLRAREAQLLITVLAAMEEGELTGITFNHISNWMANDAYK